MSVEPDRENPIGGKRVQLRGGEVRLTRRVELRVQTGVLGPRFQVAPRERDTQFFGSKLTREPLRQAEHDADLAQFGEVAVLNEACRRVVAPQRL